MDETSTSGLLMGPRPKIRRNPHKATPAEELPYPVKEVAVTVDDGTGGYGATPAKVATECR